MEKLVLWQKQEYTGMTPGLARIRRFLKETGNPERRFAVVHIAGTNGKGSTAKMLSRILEEAGYVTGLYTSPHLVKINERVLVNGEQIPDGELSSLVDEFDKAGGRCGLSFFEFITAVAFHHFARRKVEVAVLETGLGGRFDATNVVEKPLVSVITDIDYDHQKILGDTIAAIAAEKAGIIKKGCPVVSGATRPAAARVLRETAATRKAPLLQLGKDFGASLRRVRWEKGLQTVAYQGRGTAFEADLSLLGEYQVRNVAVALAAAEVLREQGWRLDTAAIRRALRTTPWPGRFEIVRRKGGRTIILDGAHNPGGMRQFVKTFEESPWSKKEHVVVFGVLGDKNGAGIIRLLSRVVQRIVLVPVRSPRNCDRALLVRRWKKYVESSKIEICDSAGEALTRLRSAGTVVVTGSLYLVGEAIEFLHTDRNA